MARRVYTVQDDPATMTHTEISDFLCFLRSIKPRPLHKLYGKAGPTEAQAADHAEAMRSWNRLHRKAAAALKRITG